MNGMSYNGQARIAGVTAVGLLTITAFAIAAIFLIPIPKGNESLVGQAVGTLLALDGIIVAFFYGTSTGNRKDSETIATLAATASVAQAALTPGVKPDVIVPPGESVTVKADETGTEPKP